MRIIICLFLGIALILSSFIELNLKNQKQYKISKISKIISKIKDNKFLNILVEDSTYSDKKVLDKIKMINQCKKAEKIYKYNPITRARKLKENEEKTKGVNSSSNLSINSLINKNTEKNQESLKNLYISKILIVIISIFLMFSGKFIFSNLIVKQDLNPETIYSQTKYRVSKNDAENITDFIKNRYKRYIDTNNKDELINVIYEYASDNNFTLDKSDVKSLADIYEKAYLDGKLKLTDIIIIILIGILSNLLVDIGINVKYKICSMKLLSEFQKIELIALLHMNRKELNVYEILKEVNKFTVYLRAPLNRCLNRYNIEPSVALDKLILEVDNSDFTGFIAVLKSCLSTSKDINSDVLKLQRKLRLLNDTLEEDKRLQFKSICLTLAQIPLIALFTFNILLPLISQFSNTSLELL